MPVPRITAVVSVFVTHQLSYRRFVEGTLLEHELEPWIYRKEYDPVIYFSTIVCPERTWLPVLYASLLHDLFRFGSSHQISFETGFSVASTAAGARHLARNGFFPIGNRKYLGRYDVPIVTPASARSAFWRTLFHSPVNQERARGVAQDRFQSWCRLGAISAAVANEPIALATGLA